VTHDAPPPPARPVNASAAYGRAAQTASPVERVLMLYDGALRRIEEARRAILEGRIEDRFHALEKAGAILVGLQSSLDHARGGAIAEQLDRIYTYLDFRLHQANIRNDATICEEAAARLRELRRAWAELATTPPPVAAAPLPGTSRSRAA